ncbi:hypothetical protein OCU04_000003 [Sclerotinia nivalis]|uniref:Uncharacterized protein n=1 Tax=Sclerotinia nivalis TaxID=352851 RepID=A0A9X0AV74_9HELO|nr:hypothetical protein OCU04_000003 [Sclerotinia nivalis]
MHGILFTTFSALKTMNNTGHHGAAVSLGSSSKIVICPTADYKAPMYICYDYICRYCPSGDQGNQLIYLPQPSLDQRQNTPAPRVYTRLYHDFRYQVYAVSHLEMPPQLSRAGICFFWCYHEIDSSPTIQRTWYYGQWSNPEGGVLRDGGNQAFIDPVTGHTVIHPPVGYTIHPEANGVSGGSFEAPSSVESFQTEKSITTPSLGVVSSRSISSGSSGLLLTPRSSYNTPSTYRLPVDFHNQVEEVNDGEVEELRHGGAVFVSELTDNERTPTRDNFGGGEGGEGEGREGTATITPQRVTAGSGRSNGAGNMNPPHGPRGGGNGRGQNRGRGGRPTRIWNWHN